jgi:serine/threonine protein kinase/tetratricopeptide (TPR) repeat protein
MTSPDARLVADDTGRDAASDAGHERIGPYRILRTLGEGGMGIVYEAEELGAVRRRVALKLIKPGFASRASTARIEAERQALAVMNHPAIASVFHADSTSEGQPYFAMELVNGSPLTEYCDTQRLSISERLELFLEVCHGVQHAHQKGVIHRDLKPSNVLVVEQDGRPQPKIIDFGIAKALGQQLTESTLVTQQGQPIGTAAYMSPEQAGAPGLDVDTRADIYALGVILYELLVGELPLSPSSVGMYVYLASLATGQINAPAPSEKLGHDPREATLVSYARRSDPHRLRREIRGDLDRIVLKAIHPDRTCRYETVSALASDIERFLSHEPVLARTPSAGYRFRKFFRRHRTAVVAAGLAAAALILGSVSTTIGMVRATSAERAAAEQAAAAQEVTDFLVRLFEEPDPFVTGVIDARAREMLDRGMERVRDLAGQPLLYGRITHTMGKVYGNIGDYDRAAQLLEEALRVREQLHGPNHIEVAETVNSLGGIALTRGEIAAADRHFARALSIAERAEPRDPAIVTRGLTGLAGVRTREGRYAEAESLYVLARAVSGRTESSTAADLALGLATVYYYQNRLAEAEPLFREHLQIEERTLGADHPRVAGTLSNLGGVYFDLGRYEEALPLYERARVIYENTFGESHPDLAIILTNIAEVHWQQRRYRQAERLFRRALEMTRGVTAEASPPRATTLNGLAGVLRDQQRYEEAEPLYREALAIRERTNHPMLTTTLRDYAKLLSATGRREEASALEARAADLR